MTTELTIGGDSYEKYTVNSFAGKLNDVRIYDHCLSDKEVEEIAKGLVLHYKLDNIVKPNLLSEYVVPGQKAPGSTVASGQTNYYGKYGIIFPATTNADTYFRLFLKQQLAQGTTYTISCSVSGLLPGSFYNFPLFAQGNTSMGVLQLNHNGLCSLTFTMNNSAQNTATTPEGDTVYICFMDDSNRTLVSGQGPITVTGFKLEEGNTATDFSFIDENIVYDSSGYGNNGLIFNPLTITTDTLKYNVATVFDGNTSAIKVPYTDIASTDDIFTLNLWFKKDDLGSKNYETLFGGPSGFEMDTRAGAATALTLYMASTRGSNFAQFNFGEWYMVTLVNDGTNELYYVNTELKKTIAKKPMPAGNYYIGAWQTEIKQNYKGFISDFRIYKTALTADQILELYNTSATIDNKGNVYAREVIE